MPKPAISRPEVHRLAEACSDAGEAFQAVATRVMGTQRRLARFVDQNRKALGLQDAEVVLYMTAVCLRILEQVGGRMGKISGADLDAASSRISAVADTLLPADEALPGRVRQVAWRAQPHLLDEILWALYERKERAEGELDVPPDRAALVFLIMWAIVEAMDSRWQPPTGFPDAGYDGPVAVD